MKVIDNRNVVNSEVPEQKPTQRYYNCKRDILYNTVFIIVIISIFRDIFVNFVEGFNVLSFDYKAHIMSEFAILMAPYNYLDTSWFLGSIGLLYCLFLLFLFWAIRIFSIVGLYEYIRYLVIITKYSIKKEKIEYSEIIKIKPEAKLLLVPLAICILIFVIRWNV